MVHYQGLHEILDQHTKILKAKITKDPHSANPQRIHRLREETNTYYKAPKERYYMDTLRYQGW